MRLTHKQKILLPLAILAVVIVAILLLYISKPTAKKRFTPPTSQISVELLSITAGEVHPSIRSYGLVEPRIKSKVVAQVGGRIIFVSEKFRDGGFFKLGEPLLRIEQADFKIDVEVAEANLIEAERRLDEEYARAKQAKQDWERLGQTETPSPLVLREPQVKAAQANVKAAQAGLKRAKLNLSRTEIKAPFEGRVLSTSVDLGQVTSNNAMLGEIYATDAVEVRLPIKNSELALVNLPERYSHKKSTLNQPPKVKIHSELSGEEIWQGEIVRTSGSIDSTSRQLYIVARIDDPFGEKAEGRFPLKIGQYVTAEIKGNAIKDAISIPNKAIYQGSYVYKYVDGAIYQSDIKIAWQNNDIAIIEQGLTVGDHIVVSPLGQVASGTLVRTTEKNADKTLLTGINTSSSAEKMPLNRIPPERLEKLKQRAEKEGKTLEQVIQEMRERRQSGGKKP